MTDEVIPWLERFGAERPSLAEERNELLKRYAEVMRACRAYKSLIDSGMSEARADEKSGRRSACYTLEVVRSAARKAFATEHGWVVGAKFDLWQLRGRWRLRDLWPANWRAGECLQNAEFFRTVDGRPMVIVAHVLRRSVGKVSGFATREGLISEILEQSWHHPDDCVAILYAYAAS